MRNLIATIISIATFFVVYYFLSELADMLATSTTSTHTYAQHVGGMTIYHTVSHPPFSLGLMLLYFFVPLGLAGIVSGIVLALISGRKDKEGKEDSLLITGLAWIPTGITFWIISWINQGFWSSLLIGFFAIAAIYIKLKTAHLILKSNQ